MNCGMECIKYLLFIFNFIFALGGLAILICGILLHVAINDIDAAKIEIQTSVPVTVLIVVGAIIFVIAFFGCCGAIRESHCMIITFAVLLLTLLVIQVAIAGFVISQFKDNTKNKVESAIKELIDRYYDDKNHQNAVNTMQTFAQCCGYRGANDYLTNSKNPDQSLPYSCCGVKEGDSCRINNIKYTDPCQNKVFSLYKQFSHQLAYLAIGIAAIELVGVIFSFCLANSIRNYERRGYKV